LHCSRSVGPYAQDIYKCADPDGRVTYSNVPTRSCRKLVLDPVNLAPAPAAKPPAAAAKTPTPGNFPKVDEQTQKSRDGDRRRILENELAAEQKNAEQAKRTLPSRKAIVLPSERMQGGAISGGKVQERLQPTRTRLPCTSAMSRPSRKKSPICADRQGCCRPSCRCLNVQGNPFAGLDLLSSAVVLLDASLAIRYLNPAAENLLAISNKVFAGCPLDGVMECPPKLLAALDSVLNHGWGYTGQKIGCGWSVARSCN
jgi:hypothetical protein